MSIAVSEVLLDCGESSLSCLVSAPATPPRATVLASPGGGYGAWYWDNPIDPLGWLLRLGPTLGYAVISFDRPGSGASQALGGSRLGLSTEAEMILESVRQYSKTAEVGEGFLVIGHSLGAMVALELAALAHDVPILEWTSQALGLGFPMSWPPR